MDEFFRIAVIFDPPTQPTTACKVHVRASDDGRVSWYKLGKTSGDDSETLHSLEFEESVEPGVYGVIVANPVVLSLPPHATIIVASGKDPWPPPPAAPQLAAIEDFAARWGIFLTASGVDPAEEGVLPPRHESNIRPPAPNGAGPAAPRRP